MDGTSVKIVEKKYLVMDTHLVSFILIQMAGGSFFIWIGDGHQENGQIENLALGLGSNGTSLLSDGNVDLMSSHLASKLSVKYNRNRPVYISYNYPSHSNQAFNCKINETLVAFLNDHLV